MTNSQAVSNQVCDNCKKQVDSISINLFPELCDECYEKDGGTRVLIQLRSQIKCVE